MKGIETLGVWRYEAPGNVCDLEHCINYAHDPAMSGNFLMRRNAFDRGAVTQKIMAQIPLDLVLNYMQPAVRWRSCPVRGIGITTSHGYWWREQKSGNNDAKALQTVMECKDIVTRISQRLI